MSETRLTFCSYDSLGFESLKDIASLGFESLKHIALPNLSRGIENLYQFQWVVYHPHIAQEKL